MQAERPRASAYFPFIIKYFHKMDTDVNQEYIEFKGVRIETVGLSLTFRLSLWVGSCLWKREKMRSLSKSTIRLELSSFR